MHAHTHTHTPGRWRFIKRGHVEATSNHFSSVCVCACVCVGFETVSSPAPKGWKGLKGSVLCRFMKGVPWCVWHGQTIFPLNFIFSSLQLKQSLWQTEPKSLAQFPLQWKSSLRISLLISLARVFALPGFLISGLISTWSAQVQSGDDFLLLCDALEWIKNWGMDQQCLIYFNLSLFQFNLLDPWFLSTDSLTLQERERERERERDREREREEEEEEAGIEWGHYIFRR